AAVVVCRLADEVEPLRAARARRVEEVTVAGHGVRTHEPCATLVELSPRVLVEKRRAAAAPRQAPLLQPEHERRVETACPRAQEIDDRDTAGLVAALRPQGQALDRGEDVLPSERAGQLPPAVELDEEAEEGVVRAE